MDMFFPEEEIQRRVEKVFYVYDSSQNPPKPYEFKATHKRITLQDIRKSVGSSSLRLFNSDGAEYFEDDIKYIKNKAILYATRGDDFDSTTCFGEYEMGQKLGEGGFGNVFLATHRQTGEKYAIKIIKTENIGSVSDIDNIFVEAEILKSLNHENIVKVHNCLTLKNMEVAIIMEFLEGGELLKYVQKQKEGRLDQRTAQNFFRQIVRGMRYCHSSNLLHRDLKLQNVLLVNSQEQKIKIIDFGIAGAINLLSKDNLDTGSLNYMAPECFTNHKDYKVDGRIDVWSTGVILYCMLNGQLPFKAPNNYETIEAIKQGHYHLAPGVKETLSAQCLEVLRMCLEVNPKKRITMEDLELHPWVSKNIFAVENHRKEEPKKEIKMEVIKQEPVKEKPKPKPAAKPGRGIAHQASGSRLPAAKGFRK